MTPTELTGEPALHRPGRVDLVLMLVIVAWALFRLAPGLSHAGIWNWDEGFHMVVTRHVHDQPFAPTLFDDPVHPLVDLRQWYAYNIWLHKPVGPFWFGALMMTFTGVSTLALRLGSLFGHLVMVLTIYLLARAIAGRAPAFAASISFLCLPFVWVMTQGRFVGDVTDITLSACLCVAIVALIRAIETRAWRWAWLAGAATGAGYLCKTVLSLTPIGVAVVMAVLGAVRFCKGLRPAHLLAVFGGALAVAGPWNLYAVLTWPDLYRRVFINTLGFVKGAAQEDLAHSIRPLDAVFVEVNAMNYAPIGNSLVLLAGLWLLWRALSKREYVTMVVAAWLWATWLGHSAAEVKGHAHLWNSLAACFVGFALVLRDSFTVRPLALVSAAGALTPQLMQLVPKVSELRSRVPAVLAHTRVIPGFFEGLLFMTVAACAAALLSLFRLSGRRTPAPLHGALACATIAWVALWRATAVQSETRALAEEDMFVSHSREVGLAVDAVAPPKALLMLDVEGDAKSQFEHMNLMFWSDRLVHRGRDLQDYPQAGYHPYLISPAAEAFAPVASVPPDAWLRAYDLTAPQPAPAGLPAGVTPLDVSVNGMRVLGWASARNDSGHERYAFYVQPTGVPQDLHVVFQTEGGPVTKTVAPEASLRRRDRLQGVAWYIAPTLGPLRGDVSAIDFGSPSVRVPLAASRP